MSSADGRADILAAFERADADNCGTIGMAQLVRVFHIISPGVWTDSALATVIGRASHCRRGCGAVDYRAFVSWLFDGVAGAPAVEGARFTTLQEPVALSLIFLDASACPNLLFRVFEFLPWEQRGHLALGICRSLYDFLKPSDNHGQYWQWMCLRLVEEHRLHMPAEAEKARAIACGIGGWRSLLLELWPLRHRFTDSVPTVVAVPETSRLTAHCRVRPLAPVDACAAAPRAAKVSLPLHQRVALLRQVNPNLPQKEAMQLLMSQPEGDAAHCGVDDGFTASVLSVTPGSEGSVLTVSPGIGIRNWQFDQVFDEASSQSQVFRQCGLRLANDLLNGTNGALIVYGQTGSGKTHTMFGPHVVDDDAPRAEDGLVPRVAREILESLERRRAAGFEVQLGASYVEVFGNDVSDLLGSRLGVNRAAQHRMGHRYILEGQCEVPIDDFAALEDVLRRGENAKRKASTAMNERSSRAHTIVILRLRQRAPEVEKFVESSLSLVDLGGSERVSKSKANENLRAPGGVRCGEEQVGPVPWEEYYHCRQRITETNNINKGLLTLKRCIQALTERPKFVRAGRDPPRIPFYDSKLTQLLEPALNGQARTAFVVCCSREDVHAEETVQTLRFGKLCSSVEQERTAREPDASMVISQALEQIDREIAEVEAEIRSKERWEWRKRVEVHYVNEMDTGGAVCNKNEEMELGGLGAVEILPDDGTSQRRQVEHEVWGQVLVGAEAENDRREELLRRRQVLLGGGTPSTAASASASVVAASAAVAAESLSTSAVVVAC
mmetsp:Transcript_24887/g.71388  ORF Transcript_24887/g.71388 Transcript_24887/m.71388 type:complete len:782 (+) Transcript_24887:73-2418(+)